MEKQSYSKDNRWLFLRIAVIAGFLLTLLAVRSVSTDMVFDEAMWKRTARPQRTGPIHGFRPVTARSAMLSDLLNHHLKKGMSVREVCALLGPDINLHCDKDESHAPNNYSYWVRDVLVLGLPPVVMEESLDISLKNGKVRGWGLWTLD